MFDVWMVIITTVFTIAGGLIGLMGNTTTSKIIALVCGVSLMIFSALMMGDPRIAVEYAEADGSWYTGTVMMPFHPYAQFFLVLVSISLILGGFAGKVTE
jgi:hypothetical protein